MFADRKVAVRVGDDDIDYGSKLVMNIGARSAHALT
jgi:hypothetical protein